MTMFHDVLLLFCAGYRFTVSFNVLVRYFSSHNQLLIIVCLLWAAGTDVSGFLAALH